MRLEADRQSEVSIGNVQRYVSGHRNRAGFDLLQMGRIFDRAGKAGRIAGGKELLCLRRPAYLDSFSLGAAPRAKSDDPAERLLCARMQPSVALAELPETGHGVRHQPAAVDGNGVIRNTTGFRIQDLWRVTRPS